MTSDVLPNGITPAVVKLVDVKQLVELVIAWYDDDLAVMVRCPAPEGMRGIVVVPDIADVASQKENISRHFKRVLFQKAAVIGELKMQVTGILYLHIIIRILLSLLQ
mgnify:FL=1